MTTINLEKELKGQRPIFNTKEELLVLREAENFGKLASEDVLTRLGLNNSIKRGIETHEKSIKLKNETEVFKQENVYHISQIESLCKKYRLKFLHTWRYKGVLDKELPNKISEFEHEYGILCNGHNTSIIAPAASFNLEEKPRDPLLFYEINSDYFYLIHKWGNDLSITRSLLPLLESPLFVWLLLSFWGLPILLLSTKIGICVVLFSFLCASVIQLVTYMFEEEWVVILPENNWRNEFKNSL